RHLPLRDSPVQLRLVRPVGDDLLAGDKGVAVEDVEQAALGGAGLSVAALAVGLEDGLCLRGEVVRLGVGGCGGGGEPEEGAGERAAHGKGHGGCPGQDAREGVIKALSSGFAERAASNKCVTKGASRERQRPEKEGGEPGASATGEHSPVADAPGSPSRRL